VPLPPDRRPSGGGGGVTLLVGLPPWDPLAMTATAITVEFDWWSVMLALRDGQPQYLAYGPRAWRLLEDALSHPAAEPSAAALNCWIPAAARGNPPGLEP
jgi:hypothetical protein